MWRRRLGVGSRGEGLGEVEECMILEQGGIEMMVDLDIEVEEEG